MHIAGRVYVTADEVHEQWPDVSPARLRAWSAATPYRSVPLVRVLTLGQLADAWGIHIASKTARASPARWPVGRGGGAQNLYPWDELVEAELATRDAPEARRGGGS